MSKRLDLSALTAVVLCGGKQTRMGKDSPPKCLTRVGTKPILRHILDHLYGQGVKHIVVAVGHNPQPIIRYLYSMPYPIIISNAGPEATIWQRIIHAREYVDEDMLVCYGDEYAEVDIKKLYEQHVVYRSPATMTAWPYPIPFATIGGIGRKVYEYREKPSLMVNIGYYVFQKATLSGWKTDDITVVMTTLVESGKLYTYLYGGKRFTVNEPGDVIKAEAILGQKGTGNGR